VGGWLFLLGSLKSDKPQVLGLAFSATFARVNFRQDGAARFPCLLKKTFITPALDGLRGQEMGSPSAFFKPEGGTGVSTLLAQGLKHRDEAPPAPPSQAVNAALGPLAQSLAL
jgi:hypothetical protein